MPPILIPAGPIGQLCNFSFLLAALFSDILLIRLFLSVRRPSHSTHMTPTRSPPPPTHTSHHPPPRHPQCAYIFLLTNGGLGLPQWPSAAPTGDIALDTVTWACVTLSFHLLSLCRLLWDERPVRFASEDEEQLWRFFYRRSGMGRLEMKQVLRYGGWRHVAAGDAILRGHEARLNFCLLVEGRAMVRSMHQQHVEMPRLQLSGCCFDKGWWMGRRVGGFGGRMCVPGCELCYGCDRPEPLGCALTCGCPTPPAAAAAAAAALLNVFGIYVGFEASAAKAAASCILHPASCILHPASCTCAASPPCSLLSALLRATPTLPAAAAAERRRPRVFRRRRHRLLAVQLAPGRAVPHGHEPGARG